MEASVQVTIHKATDLSNVRLLLGVNPYCIVIVEKINYKTKVKPLTVNPVFEETFTFPVMNVFSDQVKINIYDKKELLDDAPMGSVVVPVVDLIDGKLDTRWLKVIGGGKICVTFLAKGCGKKEAATTAPNNAPMQYTIM